MAKAGAKCKYTKKKLAAAVDEYFKSITRLRAATERVDSGERDDKGHVKYEQREMLNQNGEPVMLVEYIIPPTVEDLSAYLGIHRSTWSNYCDEKEHPEFFDTTTRARGRIRAYLHRELLTREGKDIKGIMFDLQNNYDYKERKEIELGAGAKRLLAAQSLPLEEREKLLRELAQAYKDGEGDVTDTDD